MASKLDGAPSGTAYDPSVGLRQRKGTKPMEQPPPDQSAGSGKPFNARQSGQALQETDAPQGICSWLTSCCGLFSSKPKVKAHEEQVPLMQRPPSVQVMRHDDDAPIAHGSGHH